MHQSQLKEELLVVYRCGSTVLETFTRIFPVYLDILPENYRIRPEIISKSCHKKPIKRWEGTIYKDVMDNCHASKI